MIHTMFDIDAPHDRRTAYAPSEWSGMRRWLLIITLMLAPPTAAHAQRGEHRAPIDVIRYQVALDLDFDRREIAADERITAICLDEGMRSCTLDAEEINLERAAVNGARCRPIVGKEKIELPLARAMHRGDTLIIDMHYSARPTLGLKFSIDQVYTAFHTQRWLVCNADPADKAPLELSLNLPDTLRVAASGHLVTSFLLGNGRAAHSWRSSIPYSAYLFGFAAGPFNDTTIVANGRAYRLLGPMSNDTLARVFAGTPDIFAYFRERAGIDLPDTLYTQALLYADVHQEASNLALMRMTYADEILAEPREDWLMAHEAAHQWWGNMITCGNWSMIWLNEGLATFMTACYKESKWGRDEYDREIILARNRYERIRRAEGDRALTMIPAGQARGAASQLAYHKGALVLHYLRFILGEESFWKGIREYSQSRFGSTVTTADLQHALELASGRRIDRFVEQWILSSDTPELVASHRIGTNEVIVEIRQEQPGLFELPMMVAVETTTGRRTHRIVLDEERTEIRFPLTGELLSLRIDDGGMLPVWVQHARPFEMLLHQIAHEPDVTGRVEAMYQAERSFGADKGRIGALVEVLDEAIAGDSSRIVRDVAKGMKERVSKK